MLHDYESYGYGRFAIVWRATGAMIGGDRLGYRYLLQFWDRGLAKESCRMVVDHARKTLMLRRLVSDIIHPETERSKNVVRKLGVTHESARVLDGLV